MATRRTLFHLEAQLFFRRAEDPLDNLRDIGRENEHLMLVVDEIRLRDEGMPSDPVELLMKLEEMDGDDAQQLINDYFNPTTKRGK